MKTKQFYFIAGLPRSRTAWLANLLTWGNSFCHHEAFRRCGKRVYEAVDPVAEYRALLETTPYEMVGDSSSSNGFVARDLFSESKWVLIERNPETVFNSAKAAFPQFPPDRKNLHRLDQCNAALKAHLGDRLLVVQYDDIDVRVMEIINHLGIYIPDERLAQVMEMNVTLNLNTALKRWNPGWLPKPEHGGALDPKYVTALNQCSTLL